MIRGLVTAIRTLSIFPVPGRDAEHMSHALFWFPLVGCLLGVILWGLARGLSFIFGGWNDGMATVVVAGGAILTRGLHLDGLADWADGFFGGSAREDVLAVMKDSQVGAFGIVALILVLLGKWVAFSRLIEMGSCLWIVPAYIASRMTMVELAVCLPYARSEGGTAGPFVEGAQPCHRFGAILLSAALLFLFNGLAGAILLSGGWIACRLLGIWFQRRVAGVTGDLLGTCCELVETGLLLACAVGSHWLVRFTGWGVLKI